MIGLAGEAKFGLGQVFGESEVETDQRHAGEEQYAARQRIAEDGKTETPPCVPCVLGA